MFSFFKISSNFLLLLILFFTSSAFSSTCQDDWWGTQEKINTLQKELICNTSKEFKSCYGVMVAQDSVDSSLDFFSTSHNYVCAQEKNNGSLALSSIPLGAWAIGELVDYQKIQRAFVNNVEDFYYHMQLHKKRVVALAEATYDKFPELFEGIKKEQIVNILIAHDNAKVMATVQATNGDPFYKLLYEEGYGKQMSRKYIDELNHKDQKFIEEALDRHGLTKSNRDLALKMEKFFDFTDRVYNKVGPEEFGRKMYPIKLEGNDLKYEPMLKFLGANYDKIISKYEYQKLTPLNRAALFTELRTKEIMASLSGKASAGLAVKSLGTFSKGVAKGAGKVLASKIATNAFIIGDAANLMFENINNIGCSELGEHDWYKENGVCKPFIGIGPEFAKYLALDESSQKDLIDITPNQCRVVNGVFDNQEKEHFTKVTCLENGVEVTDDKNQSKMSLVNNSNQFLVYEYKGLGELNFEKNKENGVKVNIRYDEHLKPQQYCITRPSLKEVCFLEEQKTKQSIYHQKILENIKKKRQLESYFLLKEFVKCRK